MTPSPCLFPAFPPPGFPPPPQNPRSRLGGDDVQKERAQSSQEQEAFVRQYAAKGSKACAGWSSASKPTVRRTGLDRHPSVGPPSIYSYIDCYQTIILPLFLSTYRFEPSIDPSIGRWIRQSVYLLNTERFRCLSDRSGVPSLGEHRSFSELRDVFSSEHENVPRAAWWRVAARRRSLNGSTAFLKVPSLEVPISPRRRVFLLPVCISSCPCSPSPSR